MTACNDGFCGGEDCARCFPDIGTPSEEEILQLECNKLGEKIVHLEQSVYFLRCENERLREKLANAIPCDKPTDSNQ